MDAYVHIYTVLTQVNKIFHLQHATST